MGRIKEVSGFIANLFAEDINIALDNRLSTFPTEPTFGVVINNAPQYEEAGEAYAKLNGCFHLCYPKETVTEVERTSAKQVDFPMPRIPKQVRDRTYLIVPRKMAVKALVENWECLPYMLIPATQTQTIVDKMAGKNFILASLLDTNYGIRSHASN